MRASHRGSQRVSGAETCERWQHGHTASGQRSSGAAGMPAGQHGGGSARQRLTGAAQQASGQHARTHARTHALHRGSVAAEQRGARTAAQQRGIVAAWQRGSRQHGMARWAHLTGAGGRAARQRSSGPAELCVILTLLPVSLRTGGSVFRCYWALCLSVCLCVGGLDRPRGFCRVCQGGPQSAIMAFLG